MLFFVSAIGLGLMTVCLGPLLSGYFLKHKVHPELLSGLGLAGAMVLGIYGLLRVGDLALRGVLGEHLDGSWLSWLFVIELMISAVIPAALLTMRRVRTSMVGLATCSSMAVLGVILYRFDVCMAAFAKPTGMPYFPLWTETAASLAIVAGAALAFIFTVENFRVFEEPCKANGADASSAEPSDQTTTTHALMPHWSAAPHHYSLVLIVGAACAVAFLPGDIIRGADPLSTPVRTARTIDVMMVDNDNAPCSFLMGSQLEQADAAGGELTQIFLIDGNRSHRNVLFTHDDHMYYSNDQAACVSCHHLNLPFDNNTSCFECHRDMYQPTDLFNHQSHADKLGGNQSCIRCHEEGDEVKNRETAKACLDCHQEMLTGRAPRGFDGIAPSYKDIMHSACIPCHERTDGRRRWTTAEPVDALYDFFNHGVHSAATGGRQGCMDCHTNGEGERKNKKATKACIECHQDIVDTSLTLAGPPKNYHGVPALCADCHSDIPTDFFNKQRPYAKELERSNQRRSNR